MMQPKMGVIVCIVLVLLVVPRGSGALHAQQAIGKNTFADGVKEDVQGRLTKVLREKCGNACVDVWTTAASGKVGTNRSTEATSEWYGPLYALAQMAQQQLRSAEQRKEENEAPAILELRQKEHSNTNARVSVATDTACSSA